MEPTYLNSNPSKYTSEEVYRMSSNFTSMEVVFTIDSVQLINEKCEQHNLNLVHIHYYVFYQTVCLTVE